MSCYSPLWDLTFIDLTGELTGSWYCRQQVETKTDDWTVHIKTDHQSYFSSPSPVSSLWGGQYQTRVLWSKSKNVSSLLSQVQVTSRMTENNSLSSVPYHLVNMTLHCSMLWTESTIVHCCYCSTLYACGVYTVGPKTGPHLWPQYQSTT